MAIVSRGTEVKTIAEIVPGAIQGGECTPLASVIINPPVPPPDVDIVNGAVGATFSSSLAIDVNTLGAIYVRTARTIVSYAMVFLPGVTDTAKIDVWVISYPLYPFVDFTSSICLGNLPNITAANENKDTTLTGWTVDIPANSMVVFVCNTAPASANWINLVLDTTESI